MKLTDAFNIIEGHEQRGFRVSFERRENGLLHGDCFPARDEDGIDTEYEAWNLAERFAATDPTGSRFVNIYVVHARNGSPVDGYRKRIFNKH